MFSRWLDLVLPARCGGCGALGSWFCDGCRARVTRASEPTCIRCGCELEFASARCGCSRRLRALNRLRSAAVYQGPIERAIGQLKYQGCRSVARPLALLAAECLAVEGLPAAAVVAVPLHPNRQRVRGFNQAELLAGELGRRLCLVGVAGRLRRVRDTRAQVGLDRRDRLLNVAGAFRWEGDPLNGAPLLLVDDVTTTGATLEACAKSLRDAGAGVITAVTVARVRV